MAERDEPRSDSTSSGSDREKLARAARAAGADSSGDEPVHGDQLADLPTANQPLNAERRPILWPVVATVLFFGLLALLYFVGLEYLVPAD